MKNLSILAVTAMILASGACHQGGTNTSSGHGATTNPLLTASTLPFQAPPFDKIKDSDFRPAFEAGMKEHLAEIDSIANNPDPPTLANTLVPLEKSGRTLTRVEYAFFALTGANTDSTLQRLQEEIAPELSAHQDAISLNQKLFSRIKTIYDERDRLSLDPESRRLVEVYYRNFVLAGAALPDSDKATLKRLNKEEASLSARFTNQLLEATKEGALVVSDSSELDGYSAGQFAAARQDADGRGLSGKWLVPLQNTTQQPALEVLENRATREKLFENSWNRAERGDSNDTRKTIARIAEIRAKKALLLGFPNFAAWKLQDQMARTPAAVESFLDKLVGPATRKAREEAAGIQAMIDQEHGGFTLQPWDWNYYAAKVRKQKYDVDENEIKPYFVLDSVLENGVFYAAHMLYGITFKERKDIPVYQPDVRVFEVSDTDGAPLGLFYCDYFKRDNKSGGAWMSNLVDQSKLLGTKPVIYNVANFTKPAPGEPALISFDDVTTMFHEFGHALHGFFADEEYPLLSGTNVARDFVEFPSQFNEHWALDPVVLTHYAKNYKTGEVIPQALVDKIKKSATFNQGYMLTELLAAAALDMQWHTLPPTAPLQNVDQFELAALKSTHLYLPQVPPRYRSSYFMHIWGNGYAAGYYAYLWTEMLDDDAYAWFRQHGGLTRANGQRFREMILSRGNTEDYGKMFRDFTGHNPDIAPMLKDRGL
jgi:peptidyl-dipeptidase Dcp